MLDILLERRSIRKYEDKKVELEKIKQILGAGQIAPSGKNKKPWEFIIVENKEVLKAISTIKPKGGTFAEKAPLGIVVIGNEEKSDTWVEDCSIATTFMMLEAENQGLKTCWLQLKNRFTANNGDAEERAKEILDVEESKRVLCVLTIGYPAETKPAYKEENYIR